MTRTTLPARTAVAALASALLAAGCSGSDQAPAPGGTSAPASTTTSQHGSSGAPAPAPAPRPGGAPVRNPFTGVGVVPNTPTIAVKIDDTAPGRPQVNIDKADIVYIEEAEGGLSRLLAVFGTAKPVVGYVRSTRPSDPDLLLQYGRITEAASGGGGDSLKLLRRSGLRGWLNDAAAPFYRRVARAASDYINLTLDLSGVATRAGTAKPRDIGLRFAAALPGKGTAGTRVRTTVGSTPVEFRWSGPLKRYVRYIGAQAQRASDGRLVTAANVVVQACTIVPHPGDRDVNGNVSQFTRTVGSGPVSVFRGGKRFNGTWSRSRLSSGTYFIDARHHRITLAPGNTWFALVRRSVTTTGR